MAAHGSEPKLGRAGCRAREVVSEERVHELDDAGNAAEVFQQTEATTLGKAVVPGAEYGRLRAAEPVDRLLGIADDEESSREEFRAGEALEDLALGFVGILKLIDKNELDGSGQRVTHRRGSGFSAVSKPVTREADDVVEIEAEARSLLALIFLADGNGNPGKLAALFGRLESTS